MPDVPLSSIIIGGPAAPPVLLLHPAAALGSIWQPLVRAWQGQFRLLVPDLIIPPGTPPSARALAASVANILRQDGLRPAHVVGASLGANVALHLAHEHPPLVASLALDSAQAGSARPSPLVGLLAAALRATPRGVLISALMRVYAGYAAPDRAAIRADLERLGPAGISAQLRAMADHHIAPHLGAVRAPTLLLAGSRDLLTRAGEPRRLQALLPSATLVEIPGAGPFGGRFFL